MLLALFYEEQSPIDAKKEENKNTEGKTKMIDKQKK
jgi:hypothetical protein